MSGNDVFMGDLDHKSVHLKGTNNTVRAECAGGSRNFNIDIHGNNNEIIIEHCILKDFSISIGSYLPVSGVKIKIGKNFSIEPGGKFEVFTDFGSIKIGENCLFSRNIKIHYGDSPHLIFDNDTGAYRDGGGGIDIGDRVWVGEDVYMTKNAGVSSDCVVAARCVLTKTFTEPFAAYGGNPAKKLRSNIRWYRNRPQVPANTVYAQSIAKYDKKVAARLARITTPPA